MKTDSQKFVAWFTLALSAVVLMSLNPLFAQTTPVDWTVGDVFVAAGNGNYQVWHSANPGAKIPSYSRVQIISDGTTFGGTTNGGATAGCGFDLAYRFFGTNSLYSLVDRYAIDNGDNNRAIIQQLPASSGGTNTTSVAFDNARTLFVGYAGGASAGSGRIEQWTKNTTPGDPAFGLYVFTQSFLVPVDAASGPGWIDLAADGHTLFYTAQGRKIYKFDSSAPILSGTNPTVWADLSTLNGNAGSGTLQAIKILGPSYDGSNGVLVADTGNVKLINASNGIITSWQSFRFSRETNLVALTLDAFNPATTFWVGDATSNDLIQFNMATGKNVVTLNTGTGTALGGVCVNGSFNGAELNGLKLATQTFGVTPSANTISFTSPYTGAVFTATLPNLQSNVTATLRDSIVDASLALSDPLVWSFNLGNPSYGLSTVPGNMVCDQTMTSALGPNLCEVFQMEANPNSGFQGTSVVINGPGNLPGTLPNPRLLRNLGEDITDDIDLSGTKSTGKCVYTVNQQTSNPAYQICGGGFSSPASGANIVKNQASTISFKFKVSPAGECPNGQSPTFLQPLLLIVQIQPTPPTGPTPAPVPIQVIVAGNSGGPPIFVLSGNTWQLQVKTSDMAPGFTYMATMIDLSGTVPAISVPFSLQ